MYVFPGRKKQHVTDVLRQEFLFFRHLCVGVAPRLNLNADEIT